MIHAGRPGAFVKAFFLSSGIMGFDFLGVPSFVQHLFYGGGLVFAEAFSRLVLGRKPLN